MMTIEKASSSSSSPRPTAPPPRGGAGETRWKSERQHRDLTFAMGDSDAGAAAAKEARRRKIQQLEASLFGADAATEGVTGLPELQRVGEYAAQRGAAERRKKESALPSLKSRAKKMFFPDPRKAGRGYEALAHSDEETEQLISGANDADLAQHHRPKQQQQQQQHHGQRRRSSASSTTTTSANLLRSEVEQLDQSLKHLIADPKQEVLDNIKRRHGVNGGGGGIHRSPSFDPGLSSGLGSVTNVAAAASGGLSRAALVDGNSPQQLAPRRSRSMNGIPPAQQDLSQVDPRFANQSALPPPPPPDSDGVQRPSQTSPMPEIKASLPVRGALSPLTPLAAPRDGGGANAGKAREKKKKGKKKFSLGHSLSLTSSGSKAKRDPSDSFTDVVSYPENLPRASRLPAIGGLPRGPSVSTDPSGAPRRRRDPTQQQQQQPRTLSLARRGSEVMASLSDSGASSDSFGSSSVRRGSGGMVDFDGIERPSSAVPGDTFHDVPQNVMDDVPGGDTLYDDLPNNTFDEIPTNVFDAIPSAVSERESRRLKRKQEEARRRREEAEREKERSAKARDIYLQNQQRTEGDASTGASQKPGLPAAGNGFPVAHPDRQLTAGGGLHHQQHLPPSAPQAAAAAAPVREAPSHRQGSSNNISLLTALFPHAAGVDRRQQIEGDFMFAVFIQEKEQRTANAGPGAEPGAPNPRRPPTPDPDDPEVGHFCAPWVEGFCQANFCIFHHPVVASVRPTTAAAAAATAPSGPAPSAPPASHFDDGGNRQL